MWYSPESFLDREIDISSNPAGLRAVMAVMLNKAATRTVRRLLARKSIVMYSSFKVLKA